MSLAEAFPENIRVEFANRNLVIGSALYIKIEEFDVNYNKYVIFFSPNVYDSSLCGILVINTHINPQINHSPYLQSQHVLIDKANHDFLDYDSYVDCSQIHEKTKQEIVDYICNNPLCVCGNISDNIMNNIREVLINSTILSNNDKRKYGIIPNVQLN